MSRPPDSGCADDFQFEELASAINYRNAIAGEFGRFLSGRVLEVGAGAGQFTSLLVRNKGITGIVALEPDERFAEDLARRFPEIQVVCDTISGLAPEERFDAAVMINVLEHIRDDAADLSCLHRLLSKTQGQLCLFVPAGPEIYSPQDAGFGHYRRYSRKGLEALLKNAGFKIRQIHHFNLTGYFGWAIHCRLLGRTRFDPRHVFLYDRFLFPPMYWIERCICRPPFGQSLVAIATA